MLNKGDGDISKNMGALLNQPISIMIHTESDESLTKGAWLDCSKADMQMLAEEII